MKSYKFCPLCKSRLVKKEIDNIERFVCLNCGWTHYANPVPSAVAFVYNEREEILLIKRGVSPGKGKWALPSGFIEQHEVPEQTAIRELAEETHIDGRIHRLIGVYTEPTKLYGDVLLIAYDVHPIGGKFGPGSDTLEARFFPVHKLPFIPFRSHRLIIQDALAQRTEQAGLIEVLKSKITKATITRTQLFYKGSMGIDGKIMRAAGLVPGEKVHVLNYNNGERLETYTIEEKSGSKSMVLYGPASKKGKVGDKICILSYMLVRVDEAERVKTKLVILDERNRIKRRPI
jgi:L-aspartate-alpha-decarboxylase